VVSRDQMLLQARALMLGAYFQVESASRILEAELVLSKIDFDLVVLCYSIPEDEYQKLIELITRQKRRPKPGVNSLSVPLCFAGPSSAAHSAKPGAVGCNHLRLGGYLCASPPAWAPPPACPPPDCPPPDRPPPPAWAAEAPPPRGAAAGRACDTAEVRAGAA